jgi:hypoxanthine phosphoribosyltransferase
MRGIGEPWKSNIKEIIYTDAEIALRVKQLAVQLSIDYKGKDLLVIGLLKGAFIFVADLLRELTIPYQCDFMALSSYGGSTVSSGHVKLLKDVGIDPAGKHVLILEDLIDTGNTLAWMQKHLKTKECKSVKICCLLNKIARRTADVTVDYNGFECPDEFVIGYGMDYDDDYRCLPFVGVLKPEAYSGESPHGPAE